MYILNKEKKRLEPSETHCQFCESADSQDMEDNFFMPMFKENDRTNIIVYRSLKYSKIPVGIPRCKECKAIHEKAWSKGKFMAWGGAIVVIILAFLVSPVLGYISIFVGIMIGAFGSKFIYEKLVRDQIIYTERDGAMYNKAIQELLSSGWTMDQPMA